MRIVFTAQPTFSHLRPLVLPLADAARRRGHDVVVATSPELAPELAAQGWPVLTLPRAEGIGAVMMRVVGEAGGPRMGVAAAAGIVARGFVSAMGTAAGHDLVDALAADPPDLVVRENSEYGGYFAGEALGVPVATIDIGPLGPVDAPEITEAIDGGRAEFGLAPVGDPWHPSRPLRIAVTPEEYYPASFRLPAVRHVRPASEPVTASLPAAVADLPGDRPLVLATLGSNAPQVIGDIEDLLDTVITALGRLPVSAVVALGRERDPAAWRGARPDNVVLQSFAPQRELLRVSDLFVTHAGFGGVREAIEEGVPMVALPLMAEQPANAGRVADLGLGAHLHPEGLTPERLADAVATVLGDDDVRARSRVLQRRLLALPPLDAAVDDLEALARRRAASRT